MLIELTKEQQTLVDAVTAELFKLHLKSFEELISQDPNYVAYYRYDFDLVPTVERINGKDIVLTIPTKIKVQITDLT